MRFGISFWCRCCLCCVICWVVWLLLDVLVVLGLVFGLGLWHFGDFVVLVVYVVWFATCCCVGLDVC